MTYRLKVTPLDLHTPATNMPQCTVASLGSLSLVLQILTLDLDPDVQLAKPPTRAPGVILCLSYITERRACEAQSASLPLSAVSGLCTESTPPKTTARTKPARVSLRGFPRRATPTTQTTARFDPVHRPSSLLPVQTQITSYTYSSSDLPPSMSSGGNPPKCALVSKDERIPLQIRKRGKRCREETDQDAINDGYRFAPQHELGNSLFSWLSSPFAGRRANKIRRTM